MRKAPSAATRKRAASKLGEMGGRTRQRRSSKPAPAPEPVDTMPTEEHIETGEHETSDNAE